MTSDAVRDALKQIAKQPIRSELTTDDWLQADFEGAYEKMILEARTALEASPDADGFVRGLESAANIIKKRRDDYHEEHAIYDYSNGQTEYPGNGNEWMMEWDELEEAIRALSPAPASKGPTEAGELCSDCPPIDYPTDKTRCAPCPRHAALSTMYPGNGGGDGEKEVLK